MDGADRATGPVPEGGPEPVAAHANPPIDGATRAAIARAVVRIHAEHYGKGATQAKTYTFENLVVTVLRDVFTTVERTLVALDRADTVHRVRATFRETMGRAFVEAIEELTGRCVESYMSQVDPATGVGVEIFVLAPE